MENERSDEEAARRALVRDVEVDFGRNIRRLRLARNWTQEELAQRVTPYVKMHQVQVARIENASRPTPVGEVAALARVLGLARDEISRLFEDPDRYAVNMDELESEITELQQRVDTIDQHRVEALHVVGTLNRQLEDARAAADDLRVRYDDTVARLEYLHHRRAQALAEGDDGEH